MQRLLVALLAAADAAVAAAVGLAVLLAPLTLLWLAFVGASGDWSALWPTTASLWQLGHAVELAITLPDEIVIGAGIPSDAAQFVLSLAPLALMVFTALFALRSGRRAAVAGAWILGVVGGLVTFGALAVVIALTGDLEPASAHLETAVLAPTLAYGAGLVAGAVGTAWRRGDDGPISALRARIEAAGDWGQVPEAAVRGALVAIVAIVGLGAALVTVAVFTGMSEVVTLYESLRVDATGAAVVTAVQLAYLPTLITWAISWMAGPGFAVGSGTAVSPVGTELGVVPGIPVFGLLPEGTSVWSLVIVLAPVAAGALAGWAVRSRLVYGVGDIGTGPRAVVAAIIAVLVAGFGALAAALASGSIGPGRMAELGPDAAPLALALGVEVFVGAAILLLAPRHRGEVAAERRLAEDRVLLADESDAAPVAPAASEEQTIPMDLGFLGADAAGEEQADASR